MRRIMAYAMFIGLGAVLMYFFTYLNPTTPVCSQCPAEALYATALLQVRQELREDVQAYGLFNVIMEPITITTDNIVQFSHNLIWPPPCEGPDCPPTITVNCGERDRGEAQLFNNTEDRRREHGSQQSTRPLKLEWTR